MSDGYGNLGWLQAWIGRQIDTGAAQQAEVSAVPGQAMYLYIHDPGSGHRMRMAPIVSPSATCPASL